MMVVYIILFVILMAFVFSIGMLKPFMPKKEITLVILSAFIIGCLGGAFFLTPIYDEVPEMISNFEKFNPENEETMYLDVSSAVDIDDLVKNLTKTEGVKSVDVTGISFYMWSFNDKEYEYMNAVIGNLDSNYTNYTVNQSGKIDINITKGYDSAAALRSFSDWYKSVYGGSISYAQIHLKVVLASSALDTVDNELLDRDIVPSNVTGPVHNSINNTNNTMLNNNEFTFCVGIFGVIVSVLGIYGDKVIVLFRKMKRRKR